MPAYAYSIVFRTEKGDLKHYISHCYASSKQEAKGIAHEEFEDNNPKSSIASLLIREIPETPKSGTATHTYENTRVNSEFSLPDKLS